MKKLLLIGGVFLAVCCITTLGYAQNSTGKITGTVVDKSSGESMIGVNVVITGTTNGAATDIDGKYEIANLKPGTYSITASYISYASKTITGVKVEAGKATTINITLSSGSVNMNAITVSAASVKNTDAALLRQRQKAVAFSDAISAEQIQQTGSSDAADAMKRVTGATVVDGKYVFVRGLGGRYSNAELNGSPMPAADPDKNSVQMDLIPTNLLDNITTIKTFTPDKPGNFTGGNVDMETKSFPERRVLSLSISTAYNSNTNLQSGYMYDPALQMDFWGNPNSSLSMPGGVVQDGKVAIPDIGEAYGDKVKGRELSQISKQFAVQMAPVTRKAPINNSYNLAYGDQFKLAGRPLGILVSGTYSRNYNNYDNGTTGQWELSGKASEVTDLKNNYLLHDAQSSEEIQWGGLANVSYKPADNHKITFVLLHNHSGQSASRYQIGTIPRDIPDTTHMYENRVLHFTERNLNSYQIKGEDIFPGLDKISIKWHGSIGLNKQVEPNLRFFTDDFVGTKIGGVDTTIYTVSPSIYTLPSQYFRNLRETNKAANVNIAVPFRQWSGLAGNFKFGGEYERIHRSFNEYTVQFPNFGYGSNPYMGDPNAFFQPQNMGIIDSTNYYKYGSIAQNATDPAGTYSGNQDISALYGMIELPITDHLRLVTGARYETTDIKVISADTTKQKGLINNKDLLPSVNLTYQLTDNMNLRASYGKTLARPSFREIAPYASFEFVNGYIFNGNPELKRTLIYNYDLRWEWFTRPGEILSVSGFCKRFKNPIEKAFIGINGDIQYQNVDHAKVYGVEFEIRKRLDFIAPVFNMFTINTNLSLIQSEVRIPAEEYNILKYIYDNPSSTRSLQGQSPYVFNMGLTYANPHSGTTVGAYYNVFGKRLSNVSLGGTPNIYELSRNDLSIKFTQDIFNGFTLSISGKNLLNSKHREVHFYQGQQYVAEEYSTGRTVSVGVKYNFF